MAAERKFPRENIDDPYLPPIDEVMSLRQKGMSSNQIADNLGNDYSQRQISDAITQAEIKRGIAGRYPYSEPDAMAQLESMAPSPSASPDMEPSYQPEQEEPGYQEPMYQQPIMPVSQPSFQEEHVEELVESVVNEKWEDFTSKIGDLSLWKETTKNEIESIKQEILRFEQRLENLQKAVLGKVADYSKDIQDLGTDVKALEQVLQKVLGPLTTNVKELSRIADQVKKKRDSGKSTKRSKK